MRPKISSRIAVPRTALRECTQYSAYPSEELIRKDKAQADHECDKATAHKDKG